MAKNRTTGAQMLSRLYTGGVAVEKYGGGRTSYRALSTGTFVTKAAAQVLSGGAAELERILIQTWQENMPAIAPVVQPPQTPNVQVTITGLAPAALALAKGEAIRNGSMQLDAKVKPMIQRLLDKYVVMIQQLAEEVVNEVVYTPGGEAYIAASALAARSKFQNYTATDASSLMKRYQTGQSNIIRRRYPYHRLSDPKGGWNLAESEIGRRSYTGAPFTYQKVTPLGLTQHVREYTGKYIDPSLSARGRQFGIPIEQQQARLSNIERAWQDTRPGFQEKLHRGLQQKSLLGLSLLFQAASDIAGLGVDDAVSRARTRLHAPYYERTFALRDSVVQGVKRAGFNILIGVDESLFTKIGADPYWKYVEAGHEVVIPRPLGRGRPGEYEMFRPGTHVPEKPFMRTLFDRVKMEIMPLLQDELTQLGVTAQQAAFKFIQSSKVSAAGVAKGLGVA